MRPVTAELAGGFLSIGASATILKSMKKDIGDLHQMSSKEIDFSSLSILCADDNVEWIFNTHTNIIVATEQTPLTWHTTCQLNICAVESTLEFLCISFNFN